jgi:hypothetical protein
VWRQANPWTGGVDFPAPPGSKPPLALNTDLRRLTSGRSTLEYQSDVGGRSRIAGYLKALTPVDFCAVDSEHGPRRYALFSVPDYSRGSISGTEYLATFFILLTGGPVEGPLHTAQAKLGGHLALETEQAYGAEMFGEDNGEVEQGLRPSAFAIMRLTIAGGQVVAVGFSGAGKLSDADRQSFNEYCMSVQTGTP